MVLQFLPGGGLSMRHLRLQTPNMTGPDVADWQAFLKNQGILQGTADGHFGHISDSATRSYQTRAGFTADGVVSDQTMTKAVADGYVATTGANLFGMDTNVNCSHFAQDISAAEMKFVARYYSDSASKTLTVLEAQKLSDAGLNLVVVFENSNNSVELFSAEIGRAQAAKALQLAALVGQPAGSAIYFAVDFDPGMVDVTGSISHYFGAIKNVFDAAQVQYAVGVYGSGLTCRVIGDAGLAKFTWLCGSTGFREYSAFRKRAHIVQLAPERNLFDKLSIDDDIAQSAEYGAFQLGQPQQGDESSTTRTAHGT
jgi:peptidoglycan hydrolase-like protein with peptidoglycan-binding domain